MNPACARACRKAQHCQHASNASWLCTSWHRPASSVAGRAASPVRCASTCSAPRPFFAAYQQCQIAGIFAHAFSNVRSHSQHRRFSSSAVHSDSLSLLQPNLRSETVLPAYDRVLMKDCVFYSHHGVFAGERELGQKFVFDLVMHIEQFTPRAMVDGDLSATLDYGAVYAKLKPVIENTKYVLLEQLAFHIYAELFESFPMLQVLELTIKKPHVCIPGVFEFMGIQSTRDRTWWLQARVIWLSSTTKQSSLVKNV